MKVDTVFGQDLLDAIHKRLGVGGFRATDDDEHARSLIQHREDSVWIWNNKGLLQILKLGFNFQCLCLDHELLVVRTGSHKSGDSLGADIQTISPQQSISHQVTRLTLSRSGLWAAVWGQDGVTVLQMPPRAGVGGRIGGGKERLVARTVGLSCSCVDQVQSVSWHPASAGECHLVTLSRAGVLTLYSVQDMEENMRLLQCQLSDQSKVSAALGEVAVDFCFSSQAGEEGVWPLFVLLGNCDVYCVGAGLGQESWSVEGPLEMRPALEDNYSDGEACSVLETGGVLVMATVQGVVYHGVVLGGETTSLHVYERVELELSVIPGHDDVFSSPLTLLTHDNAHCQPGYLVSHNSGLHNVHLPMVTVLKQAEISGDDSPDLDSGSSIVDHLICTRPTSSSPPAPVLGACISWPPVTILCLLSSNKISCLSLPSASSSAPSLLSSESLDSTSTDSKPPSIDSQLMSLLSKKSTQPLIKTAPSADLSPALTLELLTTGTSTLRREYMARLQVAWEELVRRAGELGERMREQEMLLDKLEKQRSQARDQAESLSEKYEDVKDRGQALSQRVESVLSKLQVSQQIFILIYCFKQF